MVLPAVIVYSTVLIMVLFSPTAAYSAGKTFAAGISLLKTKGALSWWDMEKNCGSRLLLGADHISYQKEKDDSGESSSRFSAFTGEYDWTLRRQENDNVKGLYLYRGAGASLSVWQVSGADSYEVNLHVPLGIEYFLVKSIPNLSLCIEANLYAGYYYYKENTFSRDYWRVNAGVDPYLFMNFYF